jgi:hypothetical protein
MKLKLTLTALAALTFTAQATTISVNFVESVGHGNQQLGATTFAGIDSQSNWNNAPGVSGTQALNNSAGIVSGASVSWSSAGVWGDGEANVDATAGVGDAQLMRGYLDDGAPGADWTVTGIPYANYTAIIYHSTDAAGGVYRPLTVNGTEYSTTGTKARYGGQPNWDATNSITVTGLTGDLVVDNLGRDGASRASIAGFQIVQVPEPSGVALLGLAGLAFIFRRRK